MKCYTFNIKEWQFTIKKMLKQQKTVLKIYKYC